MEIKRQSRVSITKKNVSYCTINENYLQFIDFISNLSFSINFEGGKTLLETMACLMKEEDCKTLVDFDNHLDNIALDWQNLKLNDRIEEVMGKN